MKRNSKQTFTLTAVMALALGAASGAHAANSAPGQAQSSPVRVSAAQGAALAPKARGNLTRQFVNKWGSYVQRVYGVPVRVWANRMVPSFVAADSTNFANAVKRDTFEGAMAELGGTGYQATDEAIINKMAATGDSAKLIGAVSNDLVYTPIQPCRILDTRSTAAGAIPGNTTRSFIAITSGNFTGQGGSATNCGTSGLNATVMAINLTAVLPSAPGFATIYPYGTAQPLASNINYVTGAIVANAVNAQIPNPLSSFDFTIYTFAQSHYVADIVGYYAPPVATPLQCVETANTDLAITANGGTGNAVAPACATGYTQTATNCETTSWLMPIVYFQSGTCSARNGDTISQTLRASRTCCRIPGR